MVVYFNATAIIVDVLELATAIQNFSIIYLKFSIYLHFNYGWFNATYNHCHSTFT